MTESTIDRRQPTPEQIREKALLIFDAAISAADPRIAVRNHVKLDRDLLTVGKKEYDLSKIENIYVVGAGKASAQMAEPIEEVLGDRINGGFINTGYGCAEGVELCKVEVNESRHPKPDEAGVEGSRKIMDLLSRTTEKDLVICLISGGGSAILPLPCEDVDLEDLQTTTALLINLLIDELNAVRKHLSLVKGGGLARAAHPAQVAALMLSDVVGDRLDVIASGPTAPDPTTYQDAIEVIRRAGVWDNVPSSVRGHLTRGASGEIPETPKEGNPIFERTQNLVVGSNSLALDAAEENARELGFDVTRIDRPIEGDAVSAGKWLAHTALKLKPKQPTVIIGGGETTALGQNCGC